MKIARRTITTGLPVLAAAFLCSNTNAQISSNLPGGEYTCAAGFSASHNLSLISTVRSITCILPTALAHYFDMSADVPGLEGEYSTLKCVDFSFWCSDNAAAQNLIARVYQDLTPDFQPIAPEAGACCSLLLSDDSFDMDLAHNGEGCPSAYAAVDPGRTDGDYSVEIFGIEGGGILIPPDAMIWYEVAHLGEAHARFATNTAGEVGDVPGDYRRTWLRTSGCSGAGAEKSPRTLARVRIEMSDAAEITPAWDWRRRAHMTVVIAIA